MSQDTAKPAARYESPRCATCHRRDHFPGQWQGHDYQAPGFTEAPAENTRVVVLSDPYGRYIGETGTVVPEPEFAKGKSYLTGTVWVYADFQRATDATSGYAKSEPLGFAPDELAPAVEVGSPAITDDADHIERLAKLAD